MLAEKLSSFIDRIQTLQENISTEEATKTSLIMPFWAMLGYDVFNPMEFVPEFTADVGIKKGEKVDYAIILNGEPTILIEAKCVTEKLQKHDSQLFRYFGTTRAKFAVLTNGVEYRFYTDLDEPNKMDSTPFLIINLFDLKDSDITELKKFEKANFDVDNIINTASDLKYCSLVKSCLKEEFANPSDDMIKHIISADIYTGRYTQAILDKFRPIVKKSISLYINELVNDKIKSALNDTTSAPESDVPVAEPEEESKKDAIITTAEELQSFYIIRSILGSEIDISHITYKDTASYFGVILDGKVSKWICRVFLKENIKYLVIHDETGDTKHVIQSLDEIYNLSAALKKRLTALR